MRFSQTLVAVFCFQFAASLAHAADKTALKIDYQKYQLKTAWR